MFSGRIERRLLNRIDLRKTSSEQEGAILCENKRDAMRSREELEELIGELLIQVQKLDEALSEMDLPTEVQSKLLNVRGAVDAILEE